MYQVFTFRHEQNGRKFADEFWKALLMKMLYLDLWEDPAIVIWQSLKCLAILKFDQATSINL